MFLKKKKLPVLIHKVCRRLKLRTWPLMKFSFSPPFCTLSSAHYWLSPCFIIYSFIPFTIFYFPILCRSKWTTRFALYIHYNGHQVIGQLPFNSVTIYLNIKVVDLKKFTFTYHHQILINNYHNDKSMLNFIIDQLTNGQ